MAIQKTELQWQICDSDFKKVRRALQLQEKTLDVRQVFYYDTPSLQLTDQAVQVRARTKKSNSKSIVKVRYQKQEDIPWAWLAGKDFKCEEDRYLDSRQFACSVNGDSAVRFNDDQLEFLKREKNLDLSGTQIFGPSQDSTWAFEFVNEEGSFEQVLTPSGYMAQEISFRVDSSEADRQQNDLTQLLKRNQILLCEKQEGHTRDIINSFLQPHRDQTSMR